MACGHYERPAETLAVCVSVHMYASAACLRVAKNICNVVWNHRIESEQTPVVLRSVMPEVTRCRMRGTKSISLGQTPHGTTSACFHGRFRADTGERSSSMTSLGYTTAVR